MIIDHEYWMQEALGFARQAQSEAEVPVGALVLDAEGNVLAVGWNKTRQNNDPTAHAEIVALRLAAQKLNNYRLVGCRLYVTLEPCPMCAGAIQNARIEQLIFGAADYKTGACGSVQNLFLVPQWNHHTTVLGGVLAESCGVVLQRFFIEKREFQKNKGLLIESTDES